MKKKGFTLIELMVTMAIIAVLALLIIGAITIARRTANDTKRRSNIKTIQAALEAYAQGHNNKYPTSGGSSYNLSSIKSLLGAFDTPPTYIKNPADLVDPAGEDSRYCYFSYTSTYTLKLVSQAVAPTGSAISFTSSCATAQVGVTAVTAEDYSVK